MGAGEGDSTTRETTRAIAFVDCCGFTSFTAARGDAAALSLHHRLRRGLEEVLTSLPVEIVKWMGDGVMLAAQDTNALLTGLYHAMVRARDSGSLPLRAGIAVGPVLRTTTNDPDYIGMTVNRAARLCDAADPWQVRLGAEGETIRYTLHPADDRFPRWSPWTATDAPADAAQSG